MGTGVLEGPKKNSEKTSRVNSGRGIEGKSEEQEQSTTKMGERAAIMEECLTWKAVNLSLFFNQTALTFAFLEFLTEIHYTYTKHFVSRIWRVC